MTRIAPAPVRENSNSKSWIVGAIFGAITLLGLFTFAYLAGTSDQQFICKSFQLLAAVFSLGASLTAVFLGGAAAAEGGINGGFSIRFGLTGGVAVLVIMFVIFSYFQPTCSTTLSGDIRTRITNALTTIGSIQDNLGNASKYAQAAADNYSDSKTCAQHGGEAKGFVMSAATGTQSVQADLTQALGQLPKSN
ncbi:hypothetical protein FJ414_30905 [Mesorhizobium sp. B3-1-6]|uniref:hypothetical protein n=1 Tax=Mesorhizobium sp. B3-1-6 TaxID=2589895 RepID=UPI00112C0203|nr:hypothetical protein [Mesorhizobium sp. B3-1-6]TPI25119.1 hypothetical protein FJ414_30905 [Mesorhizobium sp. B3-1-6]